MKTIYTPGTAFGEYEYRVTSDGEMGSRPELVARLIKKANRE